MANPTTLADLKTRTLDFADMTNSTFPDVDRVEDYINDALAALHDLLINANQDYFKEVQNLNLVGGTSKYALPDDYYRTLGVFYKTGQRLYKVAKWNMDERDGYRDSPISSGLVEHWYIPQFTRLTDDADVVDSVLPIGWERYVALRAAADLRLRQRTGAAEMMQMADRELQRLVNIAEPRDVAQEDVIGEYYNRWHHKRHLFQSEERYFRYRVLGDNMEIIEVEYLGI